MKAALMEKISKLLKVFGYLDYAVSAGALAYGLYAQSWLYIAAGLLGFVLAYLKPAEWLKNRLTSKFIRKPVSHVSPTPEVAYSPQQPSYTPRSRYRTTTYFMGYVHSQGETRSHIPHPRDLHAMLYPPQNRLKVGVRAKAILMKSKP
jgi:hypothetical protein